MVDRQRREVVAGAHPGAVTVRPRLIVRVGVGAGCGWWAVLGLQAAVRDPWTSNGLAGAVGAVIGCLIFASALRERVEIDGEVVRVVHLVSVDDLPRAEVVAVVRAGGRGKPAHLQLRTDRETSGRYVDVTRWPPRIARRRGVAVYPGFIESKHLGQALEAPVVRWPGQRKPVRSRRRKAMPPHTGGR